MTRILNKIVFALKLLLALIILIFIGWLGLTGRFNVGSIIDKILGRTREGTPTISVNGRQSGRVVPIKKRKNPLRNKSVLELDDGTRLDLPDNLIDEDVKEVISVNSEVYDVTLVSNKCTDIFD